MIAHQITVTFCQKRQREHFHKCPTCVHYNARETPVPSLAGPATTAAQLPAKTT